MSDTQQTSAQLYRRLLSYAFQYKAYFVLSIIGFALFSGSQSALLFSLELFLNSLQGKETEWLEKFPIEFAQSIYVLPIFVIFLGITRSIGSYLGNFYISRVGMNVVNTLRKEAFKNILYLPQSTFDNNNSGSYVSLILYNVGQVQESVTRAIKTLLEDGIFLIFLLVTLFSLHWKLTMVFAVTAPLLSGIVYLAARYFRRASRRIQTIVGKVSHITNETVQGISVVKSYTAEKQEIERFSNAADTSLEYTIKFERAKALQSPIMHFVITLALAAILFLIVFFWPENDAGSAVVYVGAAFALGAPIKKLSLVNSLIQRGLAAAETIFSTIDAVKEQDSGKVETCSWRH